MLEIFLIVLCTSILTAALTAAFAWLLYNKRIKPGLEQQIAKAGDVVEERVRQGVLLAGEELLPRFREKVTEGFTRALAEWPSSEVTRMARSGANLVGEGLSTLLGKKRE